MEELFHLILTLNLMGEVLNSMLLILFVDLAQSSYIATEFNQKTAAKIIRVFLKCMARLITNNGATITSFEGDRVMGVFLGNNKNTSASTCALQMNYVVSKIIQPNLQTHFQSFKEAGFTIFSLRRY